MRLTATPRGSSQPPGQRRGTFDRYVHHVDWSDAGQVRRVLNVFEEILSWLDDGDLFQKRPKDQLVQRLRRDGYHVDDAGRIRSSASLPLDINLEALRDPAAILEHLDRIAGAMDSDPALAISGAKALVEATTKTVLEELGEKYDPRADLPALVKQTQKALQLHADDVAPTAKGVDSIRRILSSLSQIAIHVAELRNEYGPDHGRSRPTTGLRPRHAHLAVGAATTYCRTLVETLEARRGHGAADLAPRSRGKPAPRR